jgi:hypothetical protein
VSRYSSANPVVRNLAPTFFPTVMGVEVDDEPKVDGLTTSRLADTSPDSYLERSSGTAVFDEGMDLRGPVTVAAAADLSRVRGTEITRTRIVVVGDADFASNGLRWTRTSSP